MLVPAGEGAVELELEAQPLEFCEVGHQSIEAAGYSGLLVVGLRRGAVQADVQLGRIHLLLEPSRHRAAYGVAVCLDPDHEAELVGTVGEDHEIGVGRGLATCQDQVHHLHFGKILEEAQVVVGGHASCVERAVVITIEAVQVAGVGQLHQSGVEHVAVGEALDERYVVHVDPQPGSATGTRIPASII